MKTTVTIAGIRINIHLVSCVIVFISTFSLCAQAAETHALKLYWSSQRTDNFTTATAQGEKDAQSAGYRFAGIEGYVFAQAQVGAKPLKLYYSATRKDNFLTATPEGEKAAKDAGYRFARIEGYIYSTPGKGRKPLKLFYSAARKDNFTTSSAKGEQNARSGGYRFARIEGYVLINASEEEVENDVPGRYNLPDHLRPSFENLPVWRLQLRVKTSGIENANTDDEVYVQFTHSSNSLYYLDRAGDDREKNKVNTYDILDPNIRTMQDVKMLKLVIKGNDGWCVEKVELLVNDVSTPVFIKYFRNCEWLDNGPGKQPSLLISGSELRQYAGWKYTAGNKAIWLPPMIIKRITLEEMVESYVGHMMNVEPGLEKLEFGKKYGRAYVEAKQVAGNKLHFDLDLAYRNGIDLETDVDFDLVVSCQDNTINLKAESVKGSLNIPVITSLLRIFKSDFAKMDMGNFYFGNSNVPFCPNIRVTADGDITLRP